MPERLTNLLVALGTEELKRMKLHHGKRYIVTRDAVSSVKTTDRSTNQKTNGLNYSFP